MNSNTSRRRRYSARAAAIASIAIIFGAAACGTETASDKGEPAAPASTPHAQAQAGPHTPMSADAAERWGASERRSAQQRQEQYLRQLDRAAKQQDQMKLRRQSSQAPGHGREIPFP
jgi:hypothetical protein